MPIIMEEEPEMPETIHASKDPSLKQQDSGKLIGSKQNMLAMHPTTVSNNYLTHKLQRIS